jgi:hypothetical protein
VRWRQTGNTAFVRLRHISSEANGVDDSGVSGVPSGFYVRDNVLYLWPTPNAAGTLRVPYYARPNTLTAASAAGVVTAVGASTLTVSSVPGAFSSGA